MFFPAKHLPVLMSVALLTFASVPVRSQDAVSGENVRGDRETRAPQVMTPTPLTGTSSNGLYTLDEAMEQQVWQETQKRLATVEARNPKRALAEYKKFWQGRVPHPSVAIPAALKVVDLRLRMNDVDGALLTCDYMQQKYAAEPAAVQLALQKARVLVSEQRFQEAATTVDKAMPKLLALGPKSYPLTSQTLLELGQCCAQSGSEAEKPMAGMFYEGVEQVYLRWLKDGTLSHTWQMFEALQAKYQQVGDEKNAGELLPKAADVLLKMEPTEKNPEGADASVTAARWLAGHGREDDARKLYEKASRYGNTFVTQVALFDQATLSFSSGQISMGRKFLEVAAASSNGEVRIRAFTLLARSHYGSGEVEEARRYAREAVVQQANGGAERATREAQQLLSMLDRWNREPIQCEPRELTVVFRSTESLDKPIVKRILVRTFRNIALSVTADSPLVDVRILPVNLEQDARAAKAVERELLIKIVPKAIKEELKTILTIVSQNEGGCQLQVPLRVVRSLE